MGASAASLGGIANESLGVDAVVVASCDKDGITATYITAYSTTLQAYEVTGVTLSGVAAACVGLDYEVTLDDGSVSGIEAFGVVLGGGTITATFAGADAELVENLAVVISG